MDTRFEEEDHLIVPNQDWSSAEVSNQNRSIATELISDKKKEKFSLAEEPLKENCENKAPATNTTLNGDYKKRSFNIENLPIDNQEKSPLTEVHLNRHFENKSPVAVEGLKDKSFAVQHLNVYQDPEVLPSELPSRSSEDNNLSNDNEYQSFVIKDRLNNVHQDQSFVVENHLNDGNQNQSCVVENCLNDDKQNQAFVAENCLNDKQDQTFVAESCLNDEKQDQTYVAENHLNDSKQDQSFVVENRLNERHQDQSFAVEDHLSSVNQGQSFVVEDHLNVCNQNQTFVEEHLNINSQDKESVAKDSNGDNQEQTFVPEADFKDCLDTVYTEGNKQNQSVVEDSLNSGNQSQSFVVNTEIHNNSSAVEGLNSENKDKSFVVEHSSHGSEAITVPEEILYDTSQNNSYRADKSLNSDVQGKSPVNKEHFSSNNKVDISEEIYSNISNPITTPLIEEHLKNNDQDNTFVSEKQKTSDISEEILNSNNQLVVSEKPVSSESQHTSTVSEEVVNKDHKLFIPEVPVSQQDKVCVPELIKSIHQPVISEKAIESDNQDKFFVTEVVKSNHPYTTHIPISDKEDSSSVPEDILNREIKLSCPEKQLQNNTSVLEDILNTNNQNKSLAADEPIKSGHKDTVLVVDKLDEQKTENSDLDIKLNTTPQGNVLLDSRNRQNEEKYIEKQTEELKIDQNHPQEVKQLKENFNENSKISGKDLRNKEPVILPIAEKRIEETRQIKDNTGFVSQRKPSKKEDKPIERNSHKQDIKKNIQSENIDENISSGYNFKMTDLVEKLNQQQAEISDLKLKLNAAQQHNASLELQIRQNEEIVIKTQAEALRTEQNYQQEVKQLKEKLNENSKIIEKDRIRELEEQVKESKAREAKLLAEISQRTKDEVNYQKIMDQFEFTLKSRLTEFKKLQEEYETVKTHLTNLELAFSDVHSKYEKTKIVLQGLKANEEALLGGLEVAQSTNIQHEERYESLKAHARTQIEKSNKEIHAMKEQHESEINKLKAVIRRLEIKVSSLEVSLQQKSEECEQLSALCDEVTGKKV